MRLSIPAQRAAPFMTVHGDLIGYLAAPENTDGFDDLIKSCREKHEAPKAQLEQGRDRLLEIHPTVAKSAGACREH